ncbi:MULTISPECIES: GGDEF domain-containing protein [unclassified Modestobacter]|uniref:GGDEF domain-containing protein n=1 Tax=unclassified Modestobacter TaxID=2643866 RepID=UPI0022AAA3C8|nr:MULTISPECIES: GGDEF domain-containing protein [unclassified Modestobacter]MCZ2825647.1 GGDEF domain-containing protein [Modestobacter sp. VKM Ac-2981]MCZ2853288.1 GGDEF domain-containing protein [Modestobacter sp. VKM Ac-2982]
MRARAPRAAARTAVPVLLVCAVTLLVFSLFGPNAVTARGVAASWVCAALLAVLALAFRRTDPARVDARGGYVLIALLGVVLCCGMNWVTRDPSAGGQAFLAFPVLWAGVQLRRTAVALVTATALAGDAVVLFHLQPAGHAVSDLSFFGAVLVVMATMLVRAGETQDRLVAQLQQQAATDSLTGLANRRVLNAALSTALAAPVAPRGTSLVLVDVDSFKAINDEHGHPVGDDALVHIAAVLRSVVRAGDAVLSRTGGDELAVLLPDCPADVAAGRAAEVLDAVRAAPLVLPDGTLLAISVSLGVAHAPTHAIGLEELYAAADAALYAAKRAGRGRVEVAAVS